MSQLPPLARDQRAIDRSNVKLLGIFHLVGSGLALMGIGFVGLHFTLMHVLISQSERIKPGSASGPSPEQFFAIFKIFYAIAIVWFLANFVLNLLSGLFLLRRRHRIFSIVVGAINCVHIPLGTVLGVFTLVVLTRDSVRELYAAEPQ